MLCSKCASKRKKEEERKIGADENFVEKNLIFKCAKLLMRKPNNNNNKSAGK